MTPLLPVAEAQARLIALARPLPIERVPLVEAAGRWAAEAVIARRTQPFADLSAMDGYAIRFAELPGPWTVIAESAAGSPLPAPLAPGHAARIFTGAPLPQGADTILMQEDAAREGGRLMLAGGGPDCIARHVRPKGSDFGEGASLIAAGAAIGAVQIALAAIGGQDMLAVRRRARIAIISTGDELIAAGQPIAPHQLPSSNAPMLAALLGGPAAEIIDLGIAPDRLEAIVALIAAARGADIIVTTGGASVGDHDLVKPAFEAAGAALDFWKVAMRPGKPLMAGTLGDAIVLGLPGNPVSAFVTASLFVKPLIAALGGARDPFPASRVATLGASLPANGERTHFMRGYWRDGLAVPFDDQDSAALSGLASAALLIVRPAGAAAVNAGTPVEIIDMA